MKPNCFFTFILCFLTPSLLMAKSINAEEAQAKASDFFYTKVKGGKALRRAASKSLGIKLTHTAVTKSGLPAYYVFNSDDSGFVIISGDDRATDVLGYSSYGSFEQDKMPTNLKNLLDNYAHQLDLVNHSSVQGNTRRVHSDWSDIAPMLVTKWDQKAPYNALCPIDPSTGERSTLGCVPTAIAQIMYYYKFPDVGKGVKSYKWRDQDITLNLSEIRFDWENMNDQGDDITAIAQLLYSVAVVCESDFSSYGTYGWYDTIKLSKYFHYKNTTKFLSLQDVPLDDFESIVYQELKENRPVLYSSSEPGTMTHIMVIDGYDSQSGLFHINFGWGGYDDGYFSLSAIDVDYYDFTSPQAILYNIEPDYDSPQESGLYPPSSYSLSDDLTTLYKWTGPETEIDLNADANFRHVRLIASEAFKDNDSLRFINLPGQTEYIEDEAFTNCSALETVYLPASLTTVLNKAFIQCTNLTNIMVNENNPHFSGENGILYDNIYNIAYICGGGVKGTVAIKEGTVYIGDHSFENSQISAVLLPSSLDRISYDAFKDSKQITSITIPGAVTTIDSDAFSGCTSLKQIVSLATTPPQLIDEVFRGLDCASITLCVPEESVEQYRSVHGWREFTTIVGVAKPEAKKLVVYTTDGSIAEFYLSKNPMIKNRGEALEISYDGNTVSFEQKFLLKMMFMKEDADASSINEITIGNQNWHREVINFSKLPPRSRIEIFDASGRLMKKERVGETSQALNLNELGKGIFLVKVNGITYKINRK